MLGSTFDGSRPLHIDLRDASAHRRSTTDKAVNAVRGAPTIRRELQRLVLALPQTVYQILHWSRWRRWHQSLAKSYHDKQRQAWLEVLAA